MSLTPCLLSGPNRSVQVVQALELGEEIGGVVITPISMQSIREAPMLGRRNRPGADKARVPLCSWPC